MATQEKTKLAARIRDMIDCQRDRTPIPDDLKKWLASNRKAAEVLTRAKSVPADSARAGDITLAACIAELLETVSVQLDSGGDERRSKPTLRHGRGSAIAWAATRASTRSAGPKRRTT